MILSTTHSRNRGFTVAELLIVIVVIAILATIAVVSYNSIQSRAHAATTASNLKAYINAINMYELDHGSYPKASGCVGMPANDRNACSASEVVGEGCEAVGLTVGPREDSTPNDELNQNLEPYLGTIPTQPQTDSFTSTLKVTEDCNILTTSSAPVYTSLSRITIKTDGTIGLGVSGNKRDDSWIAEAYVIEYKVSGDVECHLSQSHRVYIEGRYTLCYNYGGNIVTES